MSRPRRRRRREVGVRLPIPSNRFWVLVHQSPSLYYCSCWAFACSELAAEYNLFAFAPGRTKCNKGYAFVNMTTPTAARRLYAFLHGHHWAGSAKVCEVVHAHIQVPIFFFSGMNTYSSILVPGCANEARNGCLVAPAVRPLLRIAGSGRAGGALLPLAIPMWQ